MEKRLSWSEILTRFQGEWVELIEYDWDWGRAYPRWAKVRHHSFSRFQLSQMTATSEKVASSVVLYLGAVESAVDHAETSLAI
ncbi:MAG: hypothetical protein SGJ02_01055 [bacterium]|nr:hypothetical protein [bacterium]